MRTRSSGTSLSLVSDSADALHSVFCIQIYNTLLLSVSQRGVVFFRDQDLQVEDQKILGQKLGELTGKPESSRLHIHPVTEETSELGDEVSIISSERQGEYSRHDRTQLSA